MSADPCVSEGYRYTYSEVAHHTGLSGLGGLAAGSRGRGSLVLGIGSLAGGGFSGLRHDEVQRVWEEEQSRAE